MSQVIVYMFSGETCPPCQHIKPSINELKEDYSQYMWKDCTLASPEAQELGVTSIPTMVVKDSVGVLGRHSGTTMIGYYRLLKKAKQS